ncbi:hypothetical protein LAZ67_3005171 [Cordylochernes scorpioides]|uniref:C2H2-type domain-containing protein n=1 Tax=Cordylochernes scorpioides TaxID=51811 RepID=A0ABY6KA35_9ARAC|nr:hypothetical protein LAZ67_3005171 [Cordylochernes scorpioides]
MASSEYPAQIFVDKTTAEAGQRRGVSQGASRRLSKGMGRANEVSNAGADPPVHPVPNRKLVDNDEAAFEADFENSSLYPFHPSDSRAPCPMVADLKTSQNQDGLRYPFPVVKPLTYEMAHFSDEKPFKCEYCDYETTKKHSLTYHLYTHTGEKPFKCDQCDFRTRLKKNLKRHINTHASKRPFKCEHCDYETARKESLTNHLFKHTGEKPCKCEHCDFETTSKQSLTNHLYTHTGEKPFKCEYCDYETTSKRSLTNHLYTHTSEKPFKCDYCDFETAWKESLTNHLFMHTGEKPFKCEYCDYETTWKESLTNHLFKHTGEKPFECEHCDYETTSKPSLTNHLYTHTGEKPFKCENCDFEKTSKQSLTNHLYTHTGEKPFKCEYCDYETTSKRSLTNHLYTHTSEKPFKCDYCDFKTTWKQSLTNHLFMHTDEKPFKCEYCDYETTSKKNLTLHLFKHSGERPFKCEYCDYETTSKKNLTNHLYTHTGEKPFKCEYCDYETILKQSLTNHLYTHTGEKPFKCKYCDFRSTLKKVPFNFLCCPTLQTPKDLLRTKTQEFSLLWFPVAIPSGYQQQEVFSANSYSASLVDLKRENSPAVALAVMRHAGVWLDTGGVRSSTIGLWLDYREGASESILDSGLWSSRPPSDMWLNHQEGCLSPSQTSLVGPGHLPQVRWLDHRKEITVSGSVLPRLKVASGSISTPRNHQRFLSADYCSKSRPFIVYSDNGTNSRGTANTLKKIDFSRLKCDPTLKNISWKFIPPGAPWWGGWWERLIGMMKKLLFRILGQTSLGYEELSTVMCDDESLMNTRPLTYLTEESEDLVPLTSSLFLHEVREVGVPDMNLIDIQTLYRKYQYIKRVQEDLRERFCIEYFGFLRQETRRLKTTILFKVGDMVLIGQESLKRLHWPLARIIQLYPGKDGLVRVAKVKTSR